MYNVCGVVILDLLFSYLLSLSLSLILDLEPPDDSKRKKFIAIGVVSALFLIFLILGILWWKGCFESRTTREQVMEGAIIAMCTFESKTLLIPVFNHTKFKDIAEQICSRFVGLSPEVMELTYSLGEHQSCLLQSDMDVSVMKISCCAENIASIPVSVSMVEPVEQLDPISSPHDKHIFTYEGIKPSDDRANLGKFATPHGKTYLSHAWRNYINHIGQEFPGGVKEFRHH
nr:uncharacterized protein LOC108171668 [Malus domestica]